MYTYVNLTNKQTKYLKKISDCCLQIFNFQIIAILFSKGLLF
jgi:hypothetical protein